MNATDKTSDKIKNKTADRIRQSSGQILDKISAGSDIENYLKYFADLLEDVFVNDKTKFTQGIYAGMPKIGYYCMMVPEELIYAAGCIPVRLTGGTYDGAHIGEQTVPRDACPIVKSAVGSSVTGYPSIYADCDALIATTTCDSMRKMGEELSSDYEVWMLEVPHGKESESSKRMWLEQMYGLKNRLEEFTGKKIKKKMLMNHIRKIQSAQSEARRLYDIRKNNPCVIKGSEAAIVMDSYGFDIAEEWTQAACILNNELEKRTGCLKAVDETNKPQLYLAGSPSVFPNWKIFSIIEEMGGMVKLDESCQGDRYIYDPCALIDKSMTGIMSSLASRYIMPCVCPCFTPNEDRLHRLSQIVEDFKIDGIIYNVLKGCIIYDFELSRIEKLMEKKNIPVLRIETDYNPEDIEQLRTRIEAFIELLKKRRHRGKK